MKNVNYASGKTPAEYVCAICGANGCKLWREYQTCYPTLECCDCAGKSQEKDVSAINARGQVPYKHGVLFDQIGWRVPAVPVEEGQGYWGYTLVPQEQVAIGGKRCLRARSKRSSRHEQSI